MASPHSPVRSCVTVDPIRYKKEPSSEPVQDLGRETCASRYQLLVFRLFVRDLKSRQAKRFDNVKHAVVAGEVTEGRLCKACKFTRSEDIACTSPLTRKKQREVDAHDFTTSTAQGIMNELYDGKVPSADLLASANSVAATDKNNSAVQLPIFHKLCESHSSRRAFRAGISDGNTTVSVIFHNLILLESWFPSIARLSPVQTRKQIKFLNSRPSVPLECRACGLVCDFPLRWLWFFTALQKTKGGVAFVWGLVYSSLFNE